MVFFFYCLLPTNGLKFIVFGNKSKSNKNASHSLKPKKKYQTNFYECCNLTKKVYLVYHKKPYFQSALHRKNSRESVICFSQEYISWRLFVHRIFWCQSYGTQNNNKHDEHVKDFFGNDPMDETSKSEILSRMILV